MKVAFFGPWLGEFGWELMTWQAWCRKKAREFDKSYACSFPDMAPLYTDFAEFIPHNHKKRVLEWQTEENLNKVQIEIPDDVTDQYTPPKDYRHTDGDWIRFGKPTTDPKSKILIHARGIKRGRKNYPLDQWDRLVTILASNFTGNDPGSIASVGTLSDHHIPETVDLRGIPLDELMNQMYAADCVVGQSSGVMHLASLCLAPHVAWGDSKVQFGGEQLDKRYMETWNPLKTPCGFVFEDHWKPDPVAVAESVQALMKVLPTEVPTIARPDPPPDHVVRPTLPRELRDALLRAAKAGNFFITISYNDGDKLKMWNMTQNFKKGDLIPAIEGITADVKRKNFPKTDTEEEETGVIHWR